MSSGVTGLPSDLGDAQRDEASRIVRHPKGADDDDRHGLGQRVVEQRRDQVGRPGQVRVHQNEIRGIRPRQLQCRVEIRGSLALERADARDAVVHEGLGQIFAADDQHRDRRMTGRLVRIVVGVGRRLPRSRIPPREPPQ